MQEQVYPDDLQTFTNISDPDNTTSKPMQGPTVQRWTLLIKTLASITTIPLSMFGEDLARSQEGFLDAVFLGTD